MDDYSQRDTIFDVDYFISLVRSMGYFLFSLLSLRLLLVSAASWFGCVAVLSLYFSAYLPISSLSVGIFKSLRISSFLPYHEALAIVLSIFDCSNSSLFMWLVAAVPLVVFRTSKLLLSSFCRFLFYSLCGLEFRLVSRYICLLFIRILSFIDLVWG